MSYGDYPDLQKVKKILVVKMRHHGDVLLTSPVFSHLKRVLPEAQIDAMIYQETLPMLEGHPAIGAFVLYDKGWKKLPFWKKLTREFGLLRAIRKAGYDLVINLTEGDRGAVAGWYSKAPIRVGFDPQGKGIIGKKKMYTHIVKPCAMPRHTVERQLDALRRIGIFPKPEDRDLFFHVPPSERSKVKELLAQEELRQFVVIHPVSRWLFKSPPPELFAEVIKALKAKGHQVALTSGPDPKELAVIDRIAALLPDNTAVNFGGRLTLKGLGALMEMSQGLITVDSVPLHLASALKVPVVVLFGPSSEKNWGPWQHPKSSVVAQNMPCRPCHLDGCGGSKMSDCLYTLKPQQIVQAFENVTADAALNQRLRI